jgi:hypothetical protein
MNAAMRAALRRVDPDDYDNVAPLNPLSKRLAPGARLGGDAA